MARRPTTRLLRDAALVTSVATAAQAVAAVALGAVAEAPIAFLNAALLLGATTLLGAVWGLRTHLRDASPHAPLWAASVAIGATALFLLPRLLVGAPRAAWLTLSVSLLFSLGIERTWAQWLLPPAPVGVLPRVFRITVPALAMAAAVAGTHEGPAASVVAVTVAVAAGALGWFAYRSLTALRAQGEAYAAHLDRLEIRQDAIVIPPSPATDDPWLRDVDRRLRRRATEVADVAKQDARARDEITTARQLRTRFMASMSHELRSPLSSIVGFGQLLEAEIEGELTEGQRESVVMIRRSAEELIRLLTDVLDLARLEAGKLSLDKAWVPSVELLTEAVSRGRDLVEGREVLIEAELQPGLPPVHVDRRRILQAVSALFRHAVTRMKRTQIRLRTRVAPGPPGPDPQLRIELYDAVGAIAPEAVARIFEAFSEITEPTGRRVGGLGMALSLSRELVRQHGGEVWADSVPGAGTILCVALPLEDDDGVAERDRTS